jgi:plasmid replication initiation protein
MESLISKLNPQRMDNNFQKIILSASDYAKAFNVSDKTAYRDLKNAVSGLMGKVLAIPLEEREEYTLMASAKYKDGSGVIECQFNPLIVPHLAGLKQNFTSYPLSKAVSFSSSYSWRFYELLCSWAKPKNDTGGLLCGWLTINIHEFRSLLGIPDSYRWNNIQKQVLDVVIRELKDHANIHVRVVPTKTVRTYTSLRIEFLEDDQLSLL